MTDTINIDGKDYAVSGYAEDGLPIIKATATSVQEGFDADGNPIISTHINVPAAELGITPGDIK